MTGRNFVCPAKRPGKENYSRIVKSSTRWTALAAAHKLFFIRDSFDAV
jgi:hypothetical protein